MIDDYNCYDDYVDCYDEFDDFEDCYDDHNDDDWWLQLLTPGSNGGEQGRGWGGTAWHWISRSLPPGCHHHDDGDHDGDGDDDGDDDGDHDGDDDGDDDGYLNDDEKNHHTMWTLCRWRRS